jgi:hypothetical protein
VCLFRLTFLFAIGLDITIYDPAFDDTQCSAARILARAVTAALAA